MIRPQGTVDPVRFPLGYISLTGKESIETVYEMVKDGHYVVPADKLETAHTALKGISDLIGKEHIVTTINDAVFVQSKKKELLARVLIRRDFWMYDDFNDARMNESFGIQNIYFDNYQWSQHLWPQFQSFVEKWFPSSEHSHLTYREYMSLIMYFAAAVRGISMRPLLPLNHKIKPAYGVPYPTKANREAIKLYKAWLGYFRAPLMLNKALVVHGGCGVVGLTTRLAGVPMVRVCDPSPLAIEGARADADRFGYVYRNMSFMTAEMFPPLPTKQDAVDVLEEIQNPANNAHGNLLAVKKALTKHTNYDLITLHADMPILRGLTDGDPDYHFAPGLQGYSKHLERFFEEAERYLSTHGVVAIACTNLYNLAYPDRPNPIEYEIKHNRRWVLLDYYDRPMANIDATAAFDQWSAADAVGADRSLRALQCFKGKMRSELWILHKLDSLEAFGWLHGIPGATAPSHVAKYWKRKTLRKHRYAMMKQQVELRGQDWGEYKSRMLRVLQENAGDGDDKDDMETEGEPEDEEAVQIRMTMDPTYPMVLARRARRAAEKKEALREQFHERVFDGFIAAPTASSSSYFSPLGYASSDELASSREGEEELSPRGDYDKWAADIAAVLAQKRATDPTAAFAFGPATSSFIGGPIPALSEAPYASLDEDEDKDSAVRNAAQRQKMYRQPPMSTTAQQGEVGEEGEDDWEDAEIPFRNRSQRSE